MGLYFVIHIVYTYIEIFTFCLLWVSVLLLVSKLIKERFTTLQND